MKAIVSIATTYGRSVVASVDVFNEAVFNDYIAKCDVYHDVQKASNRTRLGVYDARCDEWSFIDLSKERAENAITSVCLRATEAPERITILKNTIQVCVSARGHFFKYECPADEVLGNVLMQIRNDKALEGHTEFFMDGIYISSFDPKCSTMLSDISNGSPIYLTAKTPIAVHIEQTREYLSELRKQAERGATEIDIDAQIAFMENCMS